MLQTGYKIEFVSCRTMINNTWLIDGVITDKVMYIPDSVAQPFSLWRVHLPWGPWARHVSASLKWSQ